MRRKRGSAWAVIGAGIILLLVGIAGLSSPGASAAWFQTGTPTPGEQVLFRDDFETYSNRWLESSSPKSSAAYGDSVLNVRVVSPGVSLWSRPDFATTLDRYRVQATVDFHDGSPDSLFGFVLGYQDDDHFYALMVSPKGDWSFFHHEQQDWIDLTPLDALPVTLTGNATAIRLQVEVTPDAFTLSVNDSVVGNAALDGELSGGTFGLIVRAGHGFADVSFDDVVVTYTADASGF